MNILTSYDFYISTYGLGRKPIIPVELFLFWAQQATARIDKMTMKRTRQFNPIPDFIQFCCCQLAEHLYKADKARNTLAGGDDGILAIVPREVSVTKGVFPSANDFERQTMQIIHDWLSLEVAIDGRTPLISRGIG